MKRRTLLLMTAAFTAIFISGCVKTTDPTPPVLPTGNFTGTFSRYHLNIATGKIDTITANLTLNLSAATGYVIGGDTSKHAASHGGYVVDGTNVAFSDQTLPPSTVINAPTPTKTHLNGVYQYSYSAGVSLKIQQVGDTLIYLYNMKAQ